MIDSDVNESLVTAETSQGMEFRAGILRLTRHLVVFEVYNPVFVLRLSEVLNNFKILAAGRPVYSGRAVVNNLINTGLVVVCEATLGDSWFDVDFPAPSELAPKMREEFDRFIQATQKALRIRPEFKLVIADLQTLLMDLRAWLEQVELGVRSQPAGDRLQIERETILGLQEPIVGTVLPLLEKFEMTAQEVESEARPAHMNYLKRQIHPFVLCAPFIHRTFYKPLGYAGDYEMVNMMIRDPYEGGSIFAKILNRIFLSTPPVEAHRDRLVYLIQLLRGETLRSLQRGRPTRIFNLGCGPAKEIQDFLADHDVCRDAHFTLLDFNDETLAYTSKVLGEIKRRHDRPTQIQLAKKSVNQLIKEASKPLGSPAKYDLVYCAGLFDYLPDQVCKRLMNIFYDLLAPGGLLVATNVDDSNPSKNWMEYALDWHLVYRTGRQFATLAPEGARPDLVTVRAVGNGVNIFIEVRKPENG